MKSRWAGCWFFHVLASALVIVFCCAGALGQEEDSERQAEVGRIGAEVTSRQTRPAVEGAQEQAEIRRKGPEAPIEFYIPMPFPEPRGTVTPVESKAVSYNLRTKKETVYETEPVRGDVPQAGRIRGRGGVKELLAAADDDGDIGVLNFSSLALVDDPSIEPWRVNCKLFMTFPSGYYVASGVLIDPMHVLTAGHCVYDLDDEAWASEITAVPGYENGSEPYGIATAWATNLYSWTGWTSSGDFDYDMGIIELDRPIGFDTGWYGYGYNNSCTFFTGNEFYAPGYPAASPYNGQYMYYAYGTFNECTTNILRYYMQAYGGQSGSGANHFDGADRTVYATLSHTGTIIPSGQVFTGCIRITSSKYSDITSFINGNTPSTFDLMAANVEVSPGSVAAGEQLASMSYQVNNYSTSSWSGTVNAEVYLSTNDTISVSDALIQTHSFTHSFGAKSSYIVDVNEPAEIPAETAQGQYWLGVILDVADYDSSNNDSSGDDACGIIVYEPVYNIADFDTDGDVDLADLDVLCASWLMNDPATDIAPEGGDGVVNISDFAAFSENWLIGVP